MSATATLDQRAWSELRERLGSSLGALRTQGWLSVAVPRALERGTLFLEVPSGSARDEAYRWRTEIEGVLSESMGRRVRLRLVAPARAREEPKPKERPEGPLEFSSCRVPATTSLGRFFAGRTNRLPADFARQAVREPGAWHPLVFHGDPGSGKTHLLQGIYNGYSKRHPTRRTAYVRGERFATQFTLALRRGQAGRFRDHYRKLDLLVIDDLEGLVGKPACERELVHTLDHLLMSPRATQVVFASRYRPKEIPSQRSALEGRLLGGLVVPVAPADARTRQQVLRAACLDRGLELAPEVGTLLTTQVELTVRELLAACSQLSAQRRSLGSAINLPTAQRVLRDLLSGRREVATLEAVSAFAAEALGVELELLRGRSRQPRVVKARNLIMGLTRHLTGLTLREVGVFFGGRSVASVHAAQARAETLRESDPQARELWERAERRFDMAATNA